MPKSTPRKRFIDQDYSPIVNSGQYYDPYELIFHWGKDAIATARAVRKKHGKSYRGFLVGAASISVNENENKVGGFVAANSKPHAEATKRCAEMSALGEAKREKYLYPVALFVIGTTDPKLIKEVTGRATPTLHPCDPCRTLIHESTVVVSVGATKDVYEAYTGRQIWDLYDLGKQSETSGRLVRDPGFLHFTGSEAVYSEMVNSLRDAPEIATRMMRAEAAVEALMVAA